MLVSSGQLAIRSRMPQQLEDGPYAGASIERKSLPVMETLHRQSAVLIDGHRRLPSSAPTQSDFGQELVDLEIRQIIEQLEDSTMPSGVNENRAFAAMFGPPVSGSALRAIPLSSTGVMFQIASSFSARVMLSLAPVSWAMMAARILSGDCRSVRSQKP